MIDFRTDKQKERDQSDAIVADRYNYLRSVAPENTKVSRIIEVMKAESTCPYKSFSGVRNALIRTNTIQVS